MSYLKRSRPPRQKIQERIDACSCYQAAVSSHRREVRAFLSTNLDVNRKQVVSLHPTR